MTMFDSRQRRSMARPGQRLAVCLLLFFCIPALAAPKFRDPLDTPASMRTALTQRPLMAVAHAGQRLIAVGSRGMIVGSDDGGKTWLQSQVPVQSDLLAVHFPTALEGWAVGHEGVVLHSTDGGRTWTKQLDGRMAAAAFNAYYQNGAGGTGGANAIKLLELNYKAGPALPFLDVWFEDAHTGFAVGSFGMLIGTTDGGKTWEPWLHRIDNSDALNLNAIHRIGPDIYIAGERGRIYRLDRTRGHFARIDTGYIGSFFGIVGSGDTLIAYGLGGVAYRSGNRGAEWHALAMPSEQTITAGLTLGDGAGYVLANAAGQFLFSEASGKTFRIAPAQMAMRVTGITTSGADTFAITGLDGVRIEFLRNAASANH